MTYLPIARKYRPQTFAEVIGQEVAVKTLQNAITANRLHHAYLFSGIRGVGKTSLARILAKSLNCEQGPTLSPCGNCSVCREIGQGISLDVLEIDGASNTGVDDIRELKEQVAYLPQKGKYKIYIIDEVHMLSTSAFNALLKVLEEPPPHVIFCFATTESHKIPLTILSRCQHFELRRIPFADILAHLKIVCEREKVGYDDESLARIARLGDGSLRDSLGLLDQAIGLSGASVKREFLDQWLGFSHEELSLRLLSAVVTGNQVALVAEFETLQSVSLDPERFLAAFLELVRHLILVQAGASRSQFPELGPEDYGRLTELAKHCGAFQLDWIFQMGVRGLSDLAESHLPLYTLEILFLRFSRARLLEEKFQGSLQALPSPMEKNEGNPAISSEAWQGFVRSLCAALPQLGSLLAHVKWHWNGRDTLVLYPEQEGFYLDMLQEKKDRVEALATEFFKRKTTVWVKTSKDLVATEAGAVKDSVVVEDNKEKMAKQQAAAQDAEKNPIVRALSEIFEAKVEQVKPLS